MADMSKVCKLTKDIKEALKTVVKIYDEMISDSKSGQFKKNFGYGKRMLEVSGNGKSWISELRPRKIDLEEDLSQLLIPKDPQWL